ncbi:MAG: lipid IV(A) 3-deoxy-D-manno-octulosonic acid transferase [Algicola sp.]|nr:lipid IV(A) 3-deoxy-D-manno-octulosonic acid transferase [Algicola sp.]
MSRILFSAVIYLLLPLLFLRLWLKGRQSPDYRKRWTERLGFFNAPANIENGICFHCVSVGETLAAIPLIKNTFEQFPELNITVTTTTPTGSERVKAAFGDSVFHVYLPFDTPGAIKRFFAKVKPQLLVIIETELWPNLLHYARQYDCKTILANARLSQKSADGYRKITRLSRKMMKDVDLIAAHHQQDGERFIQLGLEQHKLTVTGSIKFDMNIDADLIEKSQALKALWAGEGAANRPIWVVGSTHQGEDELILQAFKQILTTIPNTLLVLVPRHPERFEQVAKLVETAKLSIIKRSDNIAPTDATQVVLGDTMGELMLFWGISDVAFVGGSLVERGGHNPLEPAALSVPVLSGPHVFNFKAIYALLEQQKAVIITPDPQTLANSVIHLLQDKGARETLGNNGFVVVEENRGALARLQSEISKLLVK